MLERQIDFVAQQEEAMVLLQSEIDQNHYEIEELTDKRLDIQLEYRDKQKQLAKFRA